MYSKLKDAELVDQGYWAEYLKNKHMALCFFGVIHSSNWVTYPLKGHP